MQRHLRETLTPRVMTSSTTDKQNRRALRQKYRRLRRELPGRTQREHASAVVRHLRSSNLLLRHGSVTAYLTNHRDGELDCLPAIRALWAMNRTILLPVVGRTRGFMHLYRYQRDTRLIVNRYGIAEPAADDQHIGLMAVSLVLLPLVAFDDAGGRLGMGGGYYDRFLSTLPAGMRPRLVGLGHEIQRSPTPLPADNWDIPLDDIVTEAGWRQCHAARH